MYQFLRRIPIQNCTIRCQIVNRVSSEKQVGQAARNNMMPVCTLHIGTLLRKVPKLGLVQGSAWWNGWVVTRMPTLLNWGCVLCVSTGCNFRVSRKLPTFYVEKLSYDTIETNQLCQVDLPNRPWNFKRSAFDVHSSFSAQIWLGIITKTLTFPKRCPIHANSRDRVRSWACKEACFYLGANTRPYPESC